MRFIINILVLVMLLGILAGAVMYRQERDEFFVDRETTRLELQRIRQQVRVQSALEQVERTPRGYPTTIDPGWFLGDLPENPLFHDPHPLIEVADESQSHLFHPPSRVAGTSKIAMFWYNPYNGVARARIPAGITDAQAVELYNYINDSGLPSIFAEDSEDRARH